MEVLMQGFSAEIFHAKELVQDLVREFCIRLARPQGAADLIASRIPPGLNTWLLAVGCWLCSCFVAVLLFCCLAVLLSAGLLVVVLLCRWAKTFG